MERRKAELSDLQSFLLRIDKEVTMVLQSLQWDRKHLLEGDAMETCSVNAHHKVPRLKKQVHERECVLASHGGSNNVLMLPDPADENAATFVTFSKDMIRDIIVKASQADSHFRIGHGHTDPVEPLTLDRLQSTYTSDERRAIHDAVVAAAPEHGDLADLPLASGEERKAERAKSKLQVLCELRDMKRRRTKYRVATKGGNYSDVLRAVISSQMELFSEGKNKTENVQYNLVHGANTGLVEEKESGHFSNERETEPSETKYKDKESRHDKIDRSKEAGARERYHREDSKRRDNRDRNYDKADRNEKNSRNKDKHFDKEYAVRKRNEEGVRDKQHYRKDIGSSSKRDYEHKKDYRKFEHERDLKWSNSKSLKRSDHSQEKYEVVRVKTERESVSPGSSKDRKGYKEYARCKEESRSYEKNKIKSRENWEDHKKYINADKKHKRYHEFDDTNENRKRHKKHSEDRYRD